jgi:phosphoribosyl 1,2-cyclic phosphodiesterase/peroxiredoxin
MIQLGDKAPLWSAQSTEGKVNLTDYIGRVGVLLVFYQADWTESCSDSLTTLEELLSITEGLPLKAFGISPDGPGSHKAFAHQIGLKHISLVTDYRYQICQNYGFVNGDGASKHAAILIDQEGVVRWMRLAQESMAVPDLEQAIQMVREWYNQSSSLEEWRHERRYAMQLPRKEPLAEPTTLQLKFWGTRGSIPVSGVDHVRYGGNTSCVSLTTDTGHLYILDCGSGLRELGAFLMSPEWPHGFQHTNGKTDKIIEGYILLSHTHWDHIQGFPFFVPVFRPGNRFNIIGSSTCSQTISSILAGQMEQTYFPVSLEALPSQLTFYSLHDKVAWLDGAQVTGHALKHPIPSTAYRIEIGGTSVVYATDNEPLSLPDLKPGVLLGDDVIDANLVNLARNADILIHDAQYSTSELVNGKEGWGHSSVEVAVDTALRANVKKLVLYHHDPAHSDQTIDGLLELARQRVASHKNAKLEITAAQDGMALNFKLKRFD